MSGRKVISIKRPEPSPSLERLARQERGTRKIVGVAVIALTLLAGARYGISIFHPEMKIEVVSAPVATADRIPGVASTSVPGTPSTNTIAPETKTKNSPDPELDAAFTASLDGFRAALPTRASLAEATPDQRHLGNSTATFRLATGMLGLLRFVRQNPQYAGQALSALEDCAASTSVTSVARALCAAKAVELPGVGAAERQVVTASLDEASLRLLGQFTH